MKKFVNANIYGQDEASEILVENGIFKSIGQNLDDAEEVIDLEHRLVLPPAHPPTSMRVSTCSRTLCCSASLP